MNKKTQNYIVKGKKGFIGLEDPRRSWKIYAHCAGRKIRYTLMEARYVSILTYLKNKFL